MGANAAAAVTVAAQPARRRTHFTCTECGTTHPQWAGRCSGCGEWNTLEESERGHDMVRVGATNRPRPAPITEVSGTGSPPQSTGVDELDRVLGGGLVAGSVTLLGGEPGIGKSTLLLDVAARWPSRALYVSAEESGEQVRRRADRLGVATTDLWLHPETSLPHILEAIDEVEPGMVVIDSIQTVGHPSVDGAPGGVGQVRACAARLVDVAKERGLPIVMAGHVTKEGNLAGPRVLEHVVDTVLHFEGDRHHALRLLRAVKHRFGPTTELGLFEMGPAGLLGVDDPAEVFLADRRVGVPGSAVVPTMDGQRPLVVEVQALTSPAVPGVPPRRTAQGLDGGRLSMLMTILDRRARLAAGTSDVYASTAGGLKVTEPGLDLGVCLAIASAIHDRPLRPGLAAFGEVGLGGEVRQAAHADRRCAELARLGMRQVILPSRAPDPPAGLTAIRVRSVTEAIAAADLRAS